MIRLHFCLRMKATLTCVISNITAVISRPRGFFFICLVWVALPMSVTGDLAVGVAQGDVLMSWRTYLTDISSSRIVVNPYNATVIRFSPDNVTGTATPSYSSRVTDIGNVSLGTVSFRLLRLTVVDAGRYYYKSTTGTSDGGQILVIAGVPANVSVMSVADPLESEKYTMKCSAHSTSVPLGMGLIMRYQWKRGHNQIITVSDRYSFSSDQSNLIINPLQREDADNFVCEAWEHDEAVSRSDPFSLFVFYGPDDSNVSLTPSNTSYQLIELSRLDVKCSATCFPQCNYQWSGPLVSQNDNAGLSIPQISRNQNGTFTCTVTNPKIPGKSATAKLSVIVYYGPDPGNIQLSPNRTYHEVAESTSLSVNCSTDCFPDCHYSWTGPDGLVKSNTRMLSLISIGRNQTGQYICTASNSRIPNKTATSTITVVVFYRKCHFASM